MTIHDPTFATQKLSFYSSNYFNYQITIMELFDEIWQYHRSALELTEKYSRLYGLLDRVCKQLTADYGSDFSNLFSRLYAICRHTGLKRTAIEHFRMNARRVMRGESFPDEETYMYDLKALCEAVSHFFQTPIPPCLISVLPVQWRAQHHTVQRSASTKRIRLVVDHWDEQFIYGYSDEWGDDSLLKADYTTDEAFRCLPDLLYQGAQLNLLTVSVQTDGILLPELFVVEPDYLIDISSLAECVQNYGSHPLNYLVNKFKPREISHYILLGNAANQFLDDCVNEQPGQPATYLQSIRKVFNDTPLAYTACQGIDKEYFQRAQSQFNAIRETVQAVFHSPTCQIDKDGALLEPSFLCECLGLQGRMDFLQGDFRNLIELKSGKAEGMGLNLRPRESHALQMALYKEVLYYSLDIPREAVNSYLLYSQYPKLFAERSAKAQIQRAIALRNSIVANEMALKADGGRQLLPSITPSLLNTRQVKGRLWNDYQCPQLQAFLTPFHTADELTMDYFYTFTAFVAREQFLSKMGDTRSDSNNGFASTWNCDTPTKLAAGNILTGLTIDDFVAGEGGIEKVTLHIPAYEEGFLPNFRTGDIVMLYEREGEEANATNRQVIRGSLEALETTRMVIVLKNKQRNTIVFNTASHYAIEHDFMDASYGHLFRGLYTLLTTPTHRRELLLCQRQPETDADVTLTGTYLNPQINNIVLRAKQAKDYFLLIGPPGTGKTSVALRSMVEEFHATPTNQILLLSYTNRAVDEICEMLESITPALPYLRIGGELSCEERFRPHLLRNVMQPCNKRQEVLQSLNGIRIVVGTVSSISGHPELFDLKQFDVAIIDEASQILEPQILSILCAHQGDTCAVKKFVLIGDHKQLPAVVLQRTEESQVTSEALHTIGLTDCRNSLFERLYSLQSANGNIHAMLHRQGRMHPAISAFANQQFYAGKLDIVPVAHQQAPLEWKHYDAHDADECLIATRRISFIDTPYPPAEDSNKINRHEAHIAARLVKAIYNLCQKNGLPFDAARRIGIIVPFRNQISMIANELATLGIKGTEAITIDTVERYQGSQRDIIIYSTTVSQRYQLDILSVTCQADGLTIDRKLNVALTRARKQLFITGNAHLLRHSDIYRSLIDTLEV